MATFAPFGVPQLEPRHAAAPGQAPPQNLAGQMFGQNVGNYIGGLGANPLFMAGLSGLSGYGPGAGARVAQAQGQHMQRQQMQAAWERAFPGGQPNAEHPLLRGLPPDIAGMVASMGPEQGLPLLQKFALTRAVPSELQLKAIGGQGVVFDPRTGATRTLPGIGGGEDMPKPPAGYRWAEGGALEAIPGGPATAVPGEAAGRLAMMQTARGGLQEARNIFEQSWGLGGTVGQAVVPEFMSQWSGDVGRARRTVTAAIEAALRAMTGAAAPETEVTRYEDLFMPKATDRPETVKQKLDALESFMTNAEEIATRGRRQQGAPMPGAPMTGAPGLPSGNDPLGIR